MRAPVVATIAFLVAGCASVSQGSPSSSIGTGLPSPSGVLESAPASIAPPSGVTSSASPEPTVAPPTSQSSSTPSATPAPTKTAKPSTAPAPNLVVTKVEIAADFVAAEVPVDATFNVRNIGSVEAGPFRVAILETHVDDGVKATSDFYPVDSLAAGDSAPVEISITLPKEGAWKLAATADTDDEVTESNENDNSKEVSITVLSGLPDFAWFKDGFSVFDKFEATDEGNKIELEAKFTNSGTATYSGAPIAIGVTWYRDEDSASGDLTPFAYADDLAAGATADLSKIDFLPGPGTYKLYAYLDDGRVVDELSEDNNEAQADITIN